MKKSSKGRQEWEVACHEVGLPPQKLKTLVKTRFASKIVLYQEMLEYNCAITLCYHRQSLHLQVQVPSNSMWATAKTITSILNPIVQQCVLNQTKGYLLLSDALHVTLSICLKL
jgi:hypothetical protein